MITQNITLKLAALISASLLTVTTYASGGGEAHTELFPQPQQNKELTTRPANADLTAPTYGEVVKAPSVTLKWKAVDKADAYYVQVATDVNFKWVVAENTMNKDTQFEVSKLEAGKSYFWRVSALKTNNSAGYIKGNFSSSNFKAQ